MLIINLNNGKNIRTDLSFENLAKDLEDSNLGYLRVWRHVDSTSMDYENREFVECIIDKNEVAFVDILE